MNENKGSLPIKHRPKTWSEFIGNEGTIEALKAILSRKEGIPHTIMLEGPSGCGKTTLARIISRELGCSETDFSEFNASNTRGIDTIRDIIKSSRYVPMQGDVKVYLLDECFSKNTKVLTSNGFCNISDVKEDDQIKGMDGFSKIKHLFKNKVSLERIVKLVFSNDLVLFTTKDHDFFTHKGWKKVKDFSKKEFIFSLPYNIIDDIKKNEKEQSIMESYQYRESEEYKKNKRDSSYLERGERGQWKIYPTANFAFNCLGMGGGIGHFPLPQRNFTWAKKDFFLEKTRIANLLQNRYRQSEIENSNRSGRKWSQIEREYIERQKEREGPQGVRVESVEIYKRGYNDESFKSVIGDQERDQEFVTFYDLEMEGHPSYFANGILAHNCHKLTSDAQNALLKILEDTPSHVYFILCTTEPNKILSTIRGQRAQVFPVNRLSRPVMIGFLKSIAAKEGVDFDDKFYREMAIVSEGSPRAALTIMDKIIDIEDDQAAFDAIASASFDEVEVKKLIDFLMAHGKKDWKTAANILKGLDLTGSKPEEIRVGIARYFGSVLLNKGDQWSHQVMVVFAAEPWFYSGREKLYDATYTLCR